MRRQLSYLGMAALLAHAAPAFAQDAPPPAAPDSAADLAKKLSNPIASLISVPIQMNLDWGGGFDDGGFKLTTNVQPVVPISLSPNLNLIVRTIVPIVYQSGLTGPGDQQSGLGDTVQSFFFSPNPKPGGIIWGAGPVFLYPTGTSRYTGGDKWGAGPTIVVLKQSGQSTIGLLANHIWSVAGDKARPDVNATFVQPFFSYTTKRATTYSLNTESTYNWEAGKWTVPVNVSVSQLVRVGKQPMSFGIGGRYYLSSPTGGPQWGLRVITTFLFPKS